MAGFLLSKNQTAAVSKTAVYPRPFWCPAKRSANRSVARISASVMPGSLAACPASSTTVNLAFGQAAASANA
jgi:hypothetical protein